MLLVWLPILAETWREKYGIQDFSTTIPTFTVERLEGGAVRKDTETLSRLPDQVILHGFFCKSVMTSLGWLETPLAFLLKIQKLI
jgi:hypothetical protein